MAVESPMLFPTPCKAGHRESLYCLPASPYPPSEIDVQEINFSRPFWFEADEATQDLLDVLTCTGTKPLPDWMPAFEARSLSSASTCATSPPPHGIFSEQSSTCATSPPPLAIFSEPSSPDRSCLTAPDLDEGIESPAHTGKPQCPPGALDKSSWLQARKVFVGGIPQTIDQNGLYQMFSKIGKVKKAWLQLFHNDRAANQVPTTKKHRGFGFVIFYESQAIDQLFGNESSRFVSFGNDIKLEVKRAFGKMSACSPDEAPSTGKNKKLHIAASPAATLRQSCSQMPSSASPASQACQNGSWMPSSASPVPPQSCQSVSSWMPSSASPVPQSCQSCSWAASPSWQALPGQPSLVMAFPYVPPFPVTETRIVQQPLVNNNNVQMLAASPTETSVPKAPVGQQAQCPFLPAVLPQGFMASAQEQQHQQQHLYNQALMQALLEAMPDHYED